MQGYVLGYPNFDSCVWVLCRQYLIAGRFFFLFFCHLERSHNHSDYSATILATFVLWWLFPRLQDFRRMFDHSFPACAFLFYFLSGD